MTLDKVISISGRPGLYEIQIQTRSGVVATSLADGKRITATPRDQISLLSEINMFGLEEEVSLHQILKLIFAKEEGKICSVKPKASSNDLEAFFFDVFQDYDEDRVYPSDIKKVIQWYNILQEKAPEIFTEKESIEENSEKSNEQ